MAGPCTSIHTGRISRIRTWSELDWRQCTQPRLSVLREYDKFEFTQFLPPCLGRLYNVLLFRHYIMDYRIFTSEDIFAFCHDYRPPL
jgi:hypothetical protein